MRQTKIRLNTYACIDRSKLGPDETITPESVVDVFQARNASEAKDNGGFDDAIVVSAFRGAGYKAVRDKIAELRGL